MEKIMENYNKQSAKSAVSAKVTASHYRDSIIVPW